MPNKKTYRFFPKWLLLALVALGFWMGGYQTARIITKSRQDANLSAKLIDAKLKLEKSHEARKLAQKSDRESRHKLGMFQGEMAVLKWLEPHRYFERMFERYTESQKEFVREHANKALSRLSANATDFEKAAAITSYVHQNIEPVNLTLGNAFEILKTRKSLCHGMATCVLEMLYSLHIKGEYAFLRGTYQGGHSMAQVYFSDGTSCILDPTFGVFYTDSLTGKPLAINRMLTCPKVTVHYTRHSFCRDPAAVTLMENVEGSYSTDNHFAADGFRYPELFSKALGMGVSNDGSIDFIHVSLSPGTILGSMRWKNSMGEPFPWSRLENIRDDAGNFLSWLNELGHTPLDHRVAHLYELSGLTVGSGYQLTLQVATVNPNPFYVNKQAVVSVQQIQPSGARNALTYDAQMFSPEKPYAPQSKVVKFTAGQEHMSFVALCTGYIILSAIALEPDPAVQPLDDYGVSHGKTAQGLFKDSGVH